MLVFHTVGKATAHHLKGRVLDCVYDFKFSERTSVDSVYGVPQGLTLGKLNREFLC